MTTFNYLTATEEELHAEIAALTRKNQEQETIIQSFGVNFNPALTLELKINSIIKLLTDSGIMTDSQMQYNFQTLLGDFFAKALNDVRQRALLPDPNSVPGGLLIPGR
jgi:hypothetical protein